MNLKEYLIENFKDLKANWIHEVKVKDIEHVEGVYISINPTTELNDLLNDKPIIKHLNKFIYEEEEDGRTRTLYVHKNEKWDGYFYVYECSHDLVNMPGLPENTLFYSAFDSEEEAIKEAERLGVTLERVKCENGEVVESITLHKEELW